MRVVLFGFLLVVHMRQGLLVFFRGETSAIPLRDSIPILGVLSYLRTLRTFMSQPWGWYAIRSFFFWYAIRSLWAEVLRNAIGNVAFGCENPHETIEATSGFGWYRVRWQGICVCTCCKLLDHHFAVSFVSLRAIACQKHEFFFGGGGGYVTTYKAHATWNEPLLHSFNIS